MDKKLKDALKKSLEELLVKSLMNFTEVQVDEQSDDVVRFNVTTDEPGMLIGKHGETMFALQQLFRIIAARKYEYAGNVLLDIDNYRHDQEDNAMEMAKDIARKVRSTKEPVELIPMPSYKRRAIHLMFQTEEYADLDVYSVGEKETRRIRVALKD